MRVRIDETRHYNSTPGIDDFAIDSDQLFNLGAWPDAFNPIVLNQHHAVVNDRKFTQFSAGARTRGATQRNDLGAINYGE
jgi:hypothetical protein